MQGQARAYVLIEAESGFISSIISTVRELSGVQTADPITGPYDVVVVIATDEQRDIGRLVMDQIHTITGVKRTLTCHVI